ncbi:MAG TPA: FAD-linked oxidase C-terminal domain-containing protein [Tepidisphaeraceae bacterium]|jgi:FAD/FMN-containing dehydrogenase/Fe-S oxidoreductase|nr:FAD-linked oxidase C-terminal domain-containing protein [Tepidisphaeraceae bacterium]
MTTYADPARPTPPTPPSSGRASTSLPVLPSGPSDSTDPHLEAIATDLRRLVRGQVRFGRHDRALYATDASPYQVEPIGVVIPADIDDVATAVRYCAEHRIALLPRGGGTSLAGQCTNRAVVLDLSSLCRRLLDVDAANCLCHAEPGIAIDELNRQLEARAPGLLYAPDPATVAQATVGGTIGNNAAGGRSIRYGRTSENLAGVEVLLSTGERCWLEPGAGRRSAVAQRLAQGVADVCVRHAQLIRERFPKTIRRNAGYGLDMVLQQLDRGVAVDDLDLSGLICGSEGTLAIIVGAKLKLHPAPRATALAIASFPSLDAAMDAVNPILATGPSAVELLDDVVLRAAKGNEVCRPYVDLLPRTTGGAEPAAVLYVEYQGADAADVEAGLARLTTTLPGVAIAAYRDKPAMLKAWVLRKSGEALLHGLPGRRKPQTFVEDNAVPVERLPEFVRRFREIVARHGTQASYWAHASVGVLHVRPMLDLHDPADLARMRAIAVEVADLARDCGGVMSGEHGDGRVRGPLLERFFGAELVAAFGEVKRLFDPVNILNPGILVDPGPVETITDHLRTAERAATARAPVDTYFDYGDQDDFDHAVEQCNGAGFCRKTAGGTMCPSYRATFDERHSTRGRGNALREAIRGRLSAAGRPAWDDPDTHETLDLCLSCKACKSECPSNVDVARLKAEYLAQSWRARGKPPLRAWVFGHVRRLNRLGSVTPAVANFVSNLPPVRGIMNGVLKLAPQRTLPAFGPSLYRWFGKRRQRDGGGAVAAGGRQRRPTVVLYGDCFTVYNDPHIGRAAVQVLEALGYAVELPPVACCGRAMISTGLLPDAIASSDRAMATLLPYANRDDVAAIVVGEPSCLSAMTDDWLQLKLSTPLADRKRVAAKAMLIEDFVDRFWASHPNEPAIPVDAPAIVLHGHCHQKALWGDGTSASLLRRLTGGRVTVLDSGCCGMAGSFGYGADKYDVSMAIGELSVFPPLRKADPDTVICAPGTSCRHQIKDGTGRHALHPIELAARLLLLPPAADPVATAAKNGAPRV